MSLPSEEVPGNSTPEGNKPPLPAENDTSIKSQGVIATSNGDRQEASGQHEKRDAQTTADTGQEPGESPLKRRRIDETTEETNAGMVETVPRRKGMAPVRQE